MSAAPAADDPPNAYSTSDQAIPASVSARRAAIAPCSRPLIGWRPKACMPMPTMATSLTGGSSGGRKANIRTGSPVDGVNGTMASSIGMPMASSSGRTSTSRVSTFTSPGSSTYPTGYGSNSVGPA